MQLYRGVVENNISPTKDGRVQVRIFGIHDQDKSKVKTSDLPWAEVMQAIDFKGLGIGKNTIIENNTWVFLTFDHNNKNMPIVVGTIAAHNDINTKSTPDNRVTQTKSGHLIEIDDKGRINVVHSTGTTILIDDTGMLHITTVDNTNINVTGDTNIETSGNTNIKTGADTSIDTSGETNITSGGDVTVIASNINLN